MLEKIEKEVADRLKTQPISSRVLLDRLNVMEESSRKTSQYQDPSYLPFYYYLSKSFSPKSIFQLNLDLGLPLCCFLTGSPSVESVLTFQKYDGSYYSPRIASSNIKKVRPSGLTFSFHLGSFLDESLESMISEGFDLALVTSVFKDEEFNDVLYYLWKNINLDGIMVVDHMKSNPNSFDLFKSFCKVQNRDFVLLDTRYGVAMVRK